jgi:hypothetical protein
MRLYLGLVHYPVYNKNHERIASAITTFDLHDLSRVARTYNVKRFYVITPLEDQRRLAERVLEHWTIGYGARYNPNRREALELVTLSSCLEETVREVTEIEGEKPLLIATDAARQDTRSISYAGARDIIHAKKVVILLFGTAWGLERETLNQADYILEPIEGAVAYNHLSVRAAAAIIVDRLVGRHADG